jgi:hypothetical protein
MLSNVIPEHGAAGLHFNVATLGLAMTPRTPVIVIFWIKNFDVSQSPASPPLLQWVHCVMKNTPAARVKLTFEMATWR